MGETRRKRMKNRTRCAAANVNPGVVFLYHMQIYTLDYFGPDFNELIVFLYLPRK